MSLITEVRHRADSALRGQAETVVGTARLTLSLAGNVVNGAAGDVRERLAAVSESASTNVNGVAVKVTTAATTLVDRSLKQARKQALATVGAGDFVVEALTKRAEELPLEVQRNAGRSAATASALARSARGQATTTAAAVRARGEKVVVTARKAELPEIPDVPAVRGAVDARVVAVREIALSRYEQLAERGETVVHSVRRSPRVLDAMTGVDHAVEDLADELSSVAGKARYRAAANARSVRAQKGAATRAARSAATTGAQKATEAARDAAEATVTTVRNSAPGQDAPTRRREGPVDCAGNAGSIVNTADLRPARKPVGPKAVTPTTTARRTSTGTSTVRKAASKAAPRATVATAKTTARKTTAPKITASKTTASKTTASKTTTPRKTTRSSTTAS